MSKIIKIKKGLNIPLLGEAEKILNSAPRSRHYGICPPDFHGLTPKMLVKEGDRVEAGTPLFYDKYNEKVLYTSPVSGVFADLVRGEKRRILEIRIEADSSDTPLDFGAATPESLTREEIVEKLLKSGVWPVIRQRPYAIAANPAEKPKAVFVSAFDSAPLGLDLDFVLNGQESTFQTGLNVLGKLTQGKVYLGVHAAQTHNQGFLAARGVQVQPFSGPHPAGNVGTQIHHIDPVNKGEIVWHADVQDVIIIGRLFEKGIYDASKIIALAGSEILNPRYYRVIKGARIEDLVKDNVRKENELTPRFISGNVLSGKQVELKGYLGFYDNMVCVIPEGNHPEILGWATPNLDKFSVSRAFPAFLMPWKKYRHNTNIRSGERPFVVTGLYEKVLPMDIMPMQLFKAIMINDIDMMEKLGLYELAPEDMALCEYVCPSKIEIQSLIRQGLDSLYSEFA